MSRGGSVSTGTGPGATIGVQIRIAGADATAEELKIVRRTINGRLRDAVQRAGEHSVLPAIQSDFPTHGWSSAGKQAGLPSGAMAASLYVQRDRAGVFIGSRLRGSLNRALGWIDFGGKRPRDHYRRSGPHVIVQALQGKRMEIDQEILHELKQEFSAFDTSGF